MTHRANLWLTDQKKVFETAIELDLGCKGTLKIRPTFALWDEMSD